MDTKKEALRVALLKANYECYEFAMNACNAAPVVNELHNVMINVLWPIAHEEGYGTDWVNTHPIVICYVDKLSELSRQKDDKKAWDAMASVGAASKVYMETILNK